MREAIGHHADARERSVRTQKPVRQDLEPTDDAGRVEALGQRFLTSSPEDGSVLGRLLEFSPPDVAGIVLDDALGVGPHEPANGALAETLASHPGSRALAAPASPVRADVVS